MKLIASLAAGAATLALVAGTPQPAKAQADPFLGQLMLFGGNFCPRGWSTASGQLLPIAQYSALFSLLGTTYGGDGRTTFGLPDLRGRSAMGQGTGPGLPTYNLGQKTGRVDFTLTTAELPSHNHTGTMRASNQMGDSVNPAGKALAVDASGDNIYHSAGSTTDMGPNLLKIDNTGSNMPVNKTSPALAMYWCIALQGTYPSRS